MSKYAEYDEKLMNLIRNGCNTFNALIHRLFDENKAFAEDDPWRVTDRRLQALRKAGKIVYADGRWRPFLS
ncbi:hypothetical protein [Pseudomonas sp. PI1]|uniref:hypothetical protein n=1 Tax=Pseudomonas sp. PI1 TaxID=1582493 RepID=UPI0005BBC8BF|nr:hypothetical protein [Pseudomonas sp. PI1]KWR82520.1 hypothetical protein RN02_08940 [Pseudomonas sp. PI1]